MKNKKKIILGSIIGVFIGILIGTTYAIFSYSQIGDNQQLITGDIYMHYKESNELTISNALPSNTYDPNKYFEFTIDGKNTNTKYDIYYDINLLRGAVPDGKTESNRIQDKFIKFRLTEFINGVETEIFTNKSYTDLSSSKRVHVDTISKNTREKVTHRYRLYMWISDSVVIGNTENPDKDYDITTWNNLFASIKVSSTGDFNEKVIDVEIPTIESCPGCVYTYTTDKLYTTWNSRSVTPSEITTGYSNNYEDIINSSGKNYFLGVKLNNNNEVTNAYACGVKDDEPFCIEGTSDGSKYTANQTLLQGANLYNNSCTLYPDSETGYDYDYLECGPWDNSGSLSADAYSYGDVKSGVGGGYQCEVRPDGYFGCFEPSGGGVD